MTAASRLSSFWVRALVLGTLLVAAAGATAATLFESDSDPVAERRAAVARYIGEVNAAQQTLVVELEKVRDVYRRLSLTARPVPGQLAGAEKAVRTLADLRGRFAGIPAPREAKRLQSSLLQLLDLQVALADEVAGMARYLPLHSAANRRLGVATRRFVQSLRTASATDGQQAAVAEYRGALRRIDGELQRLSAPPVFEPVRTGAIDRLQRLDALLARLDRALGARRATEIDLLFRRFVQVSSDTGVTDARREAVVAFNRKVRRIADQRSALTAELRRLDVRLR